MGYTKEEKDLAIAGAKAVGFKEYIKPATQLMIAWTPDFDTSGVSISQEDLVNGSPKEGDMIAVNSDNNKDMWLVAKEFFEANYVAAVVELDVKDNDLKSDYPHGSKSLTNTDSNGARKNVKDIVFWGNGDTFKLISKASSEKEGWMKSTKAMEVIYDNNGIGADVVVQVTTQQRNPDGSYVIAEAVTTVENAYIKETFNDAGNVTSREICKY